MQADTYPDYHLFQGDCLEVMPREIADASIDSIVTDPPYGLSFMGKGWDHGVPGMEFWQEALRVAKPGAHMLAFGGTRTFHRLACAIEDAGWEIRDCGLWLYGSGFPKSLDVSKAIDKAANAEREIIGEKSVTNVAMRGGNFSNGNAVAGTVLVTAPATDAARQWQGWGTALKPSWEPIILARKPLAGTVAANVQEYGTGALNIDACRIEGASKLWAAPRGMGFHGGRDNGSCPIVGNTQGRWPANVVLDEEAAALLDAQSGILESGKMRAGTVRANGNGFTGLMPTQTLNDTYGDTGGASRFFYTAKADAADRRGSKHPTVKPVSLIRWLVRLITPTGGLVLDPFAGSGTTGEAALEEGFRCVLIEREAEYVADIERRMREVEIDLSGRLFTSAEVSASRAPKPITIPLFSETEEASHAH